MKEAVCRGTLWGLRREARKPGSAFLFKGSKREDEPAVDAQAVTNP
jgi:NADH dehydrogenase